MSYPPNTPYGSEDRGHEPAGYPAPTSEQPPRPPSPGARVGRATAVEVRQEAQHTGNHQTFGLTVLSFRLQEPGNPQPLDVMMRGRSLSGTVRDGDWLELAGPPDATGRWDLARVQNLTTGSTVFVVGGRRSKAATVAVLVVLGIFLLVGLLIFVGVIAMLAQG